MQSGGESKSSPELLKKSLAGKNKVVKGRHIKKC